MPHFLRKTLNGAHYGSTNQSWSAGTRVEILDGWTEPASQVEPDGNPHEEVALANVVVIAGGKPVLHAIRMSDLVERGHKRGPRPQRPPMSAEEGSS